MLNMKNNILITGTVAFDDIETPFGRSGRVIGGAGVYIGLAASLFSKKLAIVSVIGEDFPEDEISFLNKRNINTEMIQIVPGGKTFYWKGKYHEDMINRDTIITELNVLENFKPLIKENYKNFKIILLGNLHPAVQNSTISQTINEKSFIILDTMNFWMDNSMNELKKAIEKTDLLIINSEEAKQLTGEKNNINSAKKILTMGPNYSIIKNGDKGSFLLSKSKKYVLPAYPVLNVIDPTGAGDSFAGGIAGYLGNYDIINFESIKKAMIIGTITASFCIESFGVEGLKNLDKKKFDERLEIFKTYLMKIS